MPLAAVLWNNGISFGGVMAFLFAHLIVLPVVNMDSIRKCGMLRLSGLWNVQWPSCWWSLHPITPHFLMVPDLGGGLNRSGGHVLGAAREAAVRLEQPEQHRESEPRGAALVAEQGTIGCAQRPTVVDRRAHGQSLTGAVGSDLNPTNASARSVQEGARP